MKPILLTLMAAALMACPALVNAQNQTDKPEQKRHMGPEERLKMLTEKLSLTADQQEKVKAIFEKYAPQMKDLMSKGRENLTEQDRTKMHELMKSQNDEINAILTPEQQEKMKAMHQKGPGEKGGKHGHGDASKQ